MRSLHQVLGLLLVLAPGLAASCSGDGSSGKPGGGGDDGLGGERSSGGDPTSGGKQTSGGKSSNTSGGAGEANAGTDSGGAAGANDGRAGADQAGAPSDAGASHGGEVGSAGGAGAGGEGGEGGANVTPTPIIVFDAGPHSGLNFGGRVGLDQHCATAKASQSIPGAVTHALISVSAADEMRDMPALYGVPSTRELVGPTGKQVADNWADLLDGSVDQSLSAADVSNAQFWISGSNPNGSVRSTCNGWTTSEFSQQVTGTYGYPASQDSLWITITDGDVYCSASQYNVICLAY